MMHTTLIMEKAKFTLNAKLEPYQVETVNKIIDFYLKNKSLICALDMGTGKTIIAIDFINYLLNNHLKNNNASILIIIPKNLMFNWAQEFYKFAPTIPRHFYTAKNRSIPQNISVVITSYNLLIRDIEIFNKYEWEELILDEAHLIKDAKTVRNKTIMSLKAKHKIAMTGTPLINNVTDLKTLINFINPGFFNSKKDFINHILVPIEYQCDVKAFEIFLQIIQNYILRIDKEVLNLPEKITTIIYCNLQKKHAFYDQELFPGSILIKKRIENVDISNKLKLLPRHKFNTEYFGAYIQAKGFHNHPFSPYVQWEGTPPFIKNINDIEPTDSAKLEALVKIIQKHKDMGEQGLIFTQFVADDILAVILKKKGFNVLFLNGNCTEKQRNSFIHNIQKTPARPEDKIDVLIISVFTGAVGVNLTAATYVIHFDLWWNYATQDQATCRAYRRGQTKVVKEYLLIAENTWDAQGFHFNRFKKQLTELILHKDNFKTFSPLTEIQLKTLYLNYINERKLLYKKKMLEFPDNEFF